VKYLWEIIDDIADDLIGDAAWEEGDATWDTSVKTDYEAKRVCHHIADDIYLSLIMENRAAQREAGGSPYNYARGLVIMFSSGWDGVNHEPSGTIYSTWLPFETFYGAATVGDLATLDLSYRLYTCAKGFALVGTPPPISADNRQSSFIIIVERNTDKLYADGFTNFYIFADGNYFQTDFNTYNTYLGYFTVNTKIKWWKVTRPFAFQSQTGWENPYRYGAFLSKGDSKVYFTKPIIHNDEDNMHPIYQAEFFIGLNIRTISEQTREKPGLMDDDEIAEPGPSTKKYQVTMKQSPDSANNMQYAIIKAE